MLCLHKYSLRIARALVTMVIVIEAFISTMTQVSDCICVVSSIVKNIDVLPLEGEKKLYFADEQDSMFK